MATYYNEFDPFAAAWLRELIKAGHIADGEVDERSIKDVAGADLAGFTQCHFFAGIGGWSYALRLAGWADHRPVWTGSCPCQPFSAAGQRKGEADDRHLWPDLRRLIAERAPPIVFGEQVESSDGRLWLAGVRADLEALAYQVGAADLCAAGVGAPHRRQRIYWLANADGGDASAQREQRGGEQRQQPEDGCDLEGLGFAARQPIRGSRQPWESATPIECADGFRRIEPEPLALANGIPNRMGRLRGYGNAIVPQVAAEFIQAADEAMISIQTVI